MTEARRLRIRYLIGDYVALNLGWFVFNVVRYYFLPAQVRAGHTLARQLVDTNILLGQFLFPFMILCLYAIWGGYQSIFFRSRIDETGRVASVSFVGSIIIYFVALFNDNIPDRLSSIELIAILWALLFIPVVTYRLYLCTLVTRRIRRGEIAFNTLIIGATRGALKLADKITESGRGGFRILGYVDTRTDTTADDMDRPVYRMKDLDRICAEMKIERLIVMPGRDGMRQTGSMINDLFHLDTRIYITPDLYSLIALRPRTADITGELLIDITHSNNSRLTLNLKRIGDVALSSITMIMLSPLYLALAIAVKYDSHGPVFYSQERIGRHKKPFKIYKYRSMRTDAEDNGPALTTLDDPRITRLGAFLRKYRLDEIPQFWNVLKGDMSLVGPRPERDFYIKQIVERAPYYSLLHQVRPGITSWGMVKYGYASDVSQMIERLRYDLVYLDNVSLGVDIKILFHTVNTVLTGKGV